MLLPVGCFCDSHAICFSLTCEKNLLLVVGFPIDVSIDEIRNLFSRCGKLEEKSEEDCTLDFRGQSKMVFFTWIC